MSKRPLLWIGGGLPLAAILAFLISQHACAERAQVRPEPVATRSEPGGTVVFEHSVLDGVLRRFVDEHGMVDYAGLQADRAALDRYVGQLASASPRSHPELFPTREHEMAFWINAYNALMLRAVIDHYPIESVTDIKIAHGVFSRIEFPVGEKGMTLDDIEKRTLLAEYDDPRVHWALTCASMSCPSLDREAFVAEGLSERLDREGRAFLSSPNGVRVDTREGIVYLSRYFKWYASDFGDDPLEYVKPFLGPDRRKALESLSNPSIRHMDYDWRLNDQAAPWARK